MKINEIFLSIQGEGYNTGLPTIFIRFTGCNLRCSYCDTTYAYDEGNEMNMDSIINKIKKYMYKRICITGGEPLLQPDIKELLENLKDYEVSIETNGTVDIESIKLRVNHIFVMDVKTPSSKEFNKNLISNMRYLRDNDEIKFVIGDRDDYEFSKEYIDKHYSKGLITFSGVYNNIDNKKIIQWILEDKMDIRFQIQLHKIIWGESETGV